MNYIKFFYKPKITYLIIAINILIFFIFSFYSSKSKPINYFQCIKTNHPNCLRLKDYNDKKASKEIANCSMKNTSLNISTEQCIYDTSECEKSNSVIKNCIPAQDKLFIKYGFIASDINFSRPYTFITSIFTHADHLHILGNMFFLLIVGAFVESRLKAKKFLILYLVSGIVASISSALFYEALGKTGVHIGASGAISGLMGANLILNRYRSKENETAMIFGRLPIQGFSISFLVIFFVQQFFLSLIDTNSDTGYIAHVTGFMAGVILVFFLKDNKRLMFSY